MLHRSASVIAPTTAHVGGSRIGALAVGIVSAPRRVHVGGEQEGKRAEGEGAGRGRDTEGEEGCFQR